MTLENLNITNSEDEFSTDSMRSSAGKVSFNTASSNDYLTREAYKTLRTNVLFCGENIKTILITSCNENEGKSTVSTELSKSLAEIGKHTLLIDADLRKSVMLRKSIKARDINGLSELLSGQVELNQVLYNTQHPDFDVIFSGQFPPNPVELLGSGRFETILKDLKKCYDYIIIDSPPLGAVIDSAVIASFCDGAIFVITDSKVNYHEAISVKDQLAKSGCKLLGAVLNDIDSKHSQYYKHYYKHHEYRTSSTK